MNPNQPAPAPIPQPTPVQSPSPQPAGSVPTPSAAAGAPGVPQEIGPNGRFKLTDKDLSSVKFYKKTWFLLILAILTLPIGGFLYVLLVKNNYKVVNGRVYQASMSTLPNRKIILIVFGIASVFAVLRVIATATSG